MVDSKRRGKGRFRQTYTKDIVKNITYNEKEIQREGMFRCLRISRLSFWISRKTESFSDCSMVCVRFVVDRRGTGGETQIEVIPFLRICPKLREVDCRRTKDRTWRDPIQSVTFTLNHPIQDRRNRMYVNLESSHLLQSSVSNWKVVTHWLRESINEEGGSEIPLLRSLLRLRRESQGRRNWGKTSVTTGVIIWEYK